jgi:hypothetical protein
MMHTMMLSLLLAGSPDSVIAAARTAVAGITDTAEARSAGYVPLARGHDLSPFQGQHWVKRQVVARSGDDLSDPPFLMFAPVRGRFTLVGVAYSRRLPHEAALPDELDGVPAMWHAHVACLNRPEQPVGLAPSREACEAAGGTAGPRKIAMVHVWFVPTVEGPFDGEDLFLPFMALGLPMPEAHALHDLDARREALAIGLALGESYGAVLPAARRIELATDASGRARLEAARVGLRMACHELRQGTATPAAVLERYDAVLAAYVAVGSPAAVADLRRQREAELSGHAHQHHQMQES